MAQITYSNKMFKNYLRENGFFRSTTREKKDCYIRHDDYIAGLYAYVSPYRKGILFTFRGRESFFTSFEEMRVFFRAIHDICNCAHMRQKIDSFPPTLYESVIF